MSRYRTRSVPSVPADGTMASPNHKVHVDRTTGVSPIDTTPPAASVVTSSRENADG